MAVKPTVEPLEERTVPASLSVSGSRLTVRGDSGDNRVLIGDNGDGDLIVSVIGAPSRSGTFQNINRINILTSSGNDRVTYLQQGSRRRNMTVSTALGSGRDSFFADVLGNVNSGRALEILVADSSASDTDVIEVQAASDVDVGSGGVFRVDLRAGGGRDRVDFNYRGELDGALSVVLDGGSGDDGVSTLFTRAVVRADPGSRGALVPSVALGGPGRDAVLFLVVSSPGDPLAVFATLDGGPGFDFGTHTSNVTAVRVERDIPA
jgi:hypothetical protein